MRYRPHCEPLEPRNLNSVVTVGPGPGYDFPDLYLVPVNTNTDITEVDVYPLPNGGAYHDKVDIGRDNLTLKGMPGVGGVLPKIDAGGGREQTDASYYFGRGCYECDLTAYAAVTVMAPDGAPVGWVPSNVTIENLDISGAKGGVSYTDWMGQSWAYADGANAIGVWGGAGVTIQNVTLHDNDQGLFVKSSDGFYSYHVTGLSVSDSYFFANGSDEHHWNMYTESMTPVFTHNYFDVPLDTAGGNVKTRDDQPTYTANYFKGGQMLFDANEAEDAPTWLGQAPGFGKVYVDGNTFVNPYGCAHLWWFGWDNSPEAQQTELYAWNNTIIDQNFWWDDQMGHEDGKYYTELLKETNGVTAYLFDNIVRLEVAANPYGSTDPGTFYLTTYTNSNDYPLTHLGVNLVPNGTIIDDYYNLSDGDANLVYGDPLFVNDAAGDYRLTAGSPAIGAVAGLWDGMFHPLPYNGLTAPTSEYDYPTDTWVSRPRATSLGASEYQGTAPGACLVPRLTPISVDLALVGMTSQGSENCDVPAEPVAVAVMDWPTSAWSRTMRKRATPSLSVLTVADPVMDPLAA